MELTPDVGKEKFMKRIAANPGETTSSILKAPMPSKTLPSSVFLNSGQDQ